MKILSFGASTSSQSINRQLAAHAASLVPDAEVTDLDLRSFELPIFSVDEEEAHGVPEAAKDFLAQVDAHDALVISLAEHNGSYAVAFKNLSNWASRGRYEVWGVGSLWWCDCLGCGGGDFSAHGCGFEGKLQLTSVRGKLFIGRGCLGCRIRREA